MLTKHLKYARYLAIHKWFVMVACFRRGLILQGIVHDWSKFLPSEWRPYAEFFYSAIDRKTRDELRQQCFKATGSFPWPSSAELRDAFNVAWLKHQHRSPHHWQHWVLRNDDGSTVLIEMPRKYALEMLCDWDGAGRAITGKCGGTKDWYLKNRPKITLHFATQQLVEKELGIA
jgi:hypothetical protein